MPAFLASYKRHIDKERTRTTNRACNQRSSYTFTNLRQTQMYAFVQTVKGVNVNMISSKTQPQRRTGINLVSDAMHGTGFYDEGMNIYRDFMVCV